MVFENGQKVDQYQGTDRDELENFIKNNNRGGKTKMYQAENIFKEKEFNFCIYF